MMGAVNVTKHEGSVAKSKEMCRFLVLILYGIFIIIYIIIYGIKCTVYF